MVITTEAVAWVEALSLRRTTPSSTSGPSLLCLTGLVESWVELALASGHSSSAVASRTSEAASSSGSHLVGSIRITSSASAASREGPTALLAACEIRDRELVLRSWRSLVGVPHEACLAAGCHLRVRSLLSRKLFKVHSAVAGRGVEATTASVTAPRGIEAITGSWLGS